MPSDTCKTILSDRRSLAIDGGNCFEARELKNLTFAPLIIEVSRWSNKENEPDANFLRPQHSPYFCIPGDRLDAISKQKR